MSHPRSTCKRCATPSTRRAVRWRLASTSRTPARALELKDNEIELNAPTEDRRRALVQVLEEKLVRRQVSLKALSYGKIEEASKGALRQTVTLNAGISSDHAKKINKLVKDLGLKGVQSQTQGDQVRVTGKKRDDLQAVIAALKEQDLDIPLQFGNFRD